MYNRNEFKNLIRKMADALTIFKEGRGLDSNTFYSSKDLSGYIKNLEKCEKFNNYPGGCWKFMNCVNSKFDHSVQAIVNIDKGDAKSIADVIWALKIVSDTDDFGEGIVVLVPEIPTTPTKLDDGYINHFREFMLTESGMEIQHANRRLASIGGSLLEKLN